MSQESVEMVRAAFNALETDGPDAVVPLLASDVEWQVRADLPDAAVYRGHEGMKRLFAAFAEVMDDTWYRPEEFIDAGDHVVVPLRWGGRGKGSGVAFEEHEETWIFAIRDGSIVQVREFATRAEALEAAGLSE